MALAINVNDLINKQKIESNRIEFKKGWNPGSIYHSICAFANDLDDLGGGYIIIGVDTDDKTGMAIRPVEGVPMEKIDGILQEMVGYNNKITPYYLPRTSVEEVDGKQVIVIWCPAGSYRPYSFLSIKDVWKVRDCSQKVRRHLTLVRRESRKVRREFLI